MSESVFTRFKKAWNVFTSRDPTYNYDNVGFGSSYSPQQYRERRPTTENNIIASIYNRISLDVAALTIKHIQSNEQGQYIKEVKDGLNECLTLQANLDQTARAFIQDVVESMLDEGVVAIVPVDTDANPDTRERVDIYTMRTARILEWYPEHVRVRLLNDRTGIKEDILILKTQVGIIENPFYAIMNNHNSTLQRLSRKLTLLDTVDEQASSGKLDMIIQLPYAIKTPEKKALAESRRKDIHEQLTNSTYGIAYMDSVERVVQLNRPIENNLMARVEYYQTKLFSELFMSQALLDGTADEQTMLNFNNRVIEPIASAICVEFTRKFLSRKARTIGQSIQYFKNPFALVPVNSIADIADKFTRNEILTSNEVREIIGMLPSSDPEADKLKNKNLNDPADANKEPEVIPEKEVEIQNE